MICPYNVKVHVTVQQWVQEYSCLLYTSDAADEL